MLKHSSDITDDFMLFALIKQGDASAFEIIYNRHWRALFNSANKRLRDKNICQDVIQNVFTDLWNRRADLEIENLQAFLQTAVKFQSLKAISKNSKQDYLINAFETEVISSLSTDENLLAQEAKILIDQFIKALPEKRRIIFIMHYFDELSTAEIAIALNISQKTVQNQLTTASHALRLRLTQLFSVSVFLSSMLIK